MQKKSWQTDRFSLFDVLRIPAEGTLSKKLAAIKRKIHPDQKNINAYVVFKEESAATQALKRQEIEVEESAVEKHFLDCGSIMAVRIVRDQVTGIGKGFGYVLFEVWEIIVTVL
ncbi:RNA-binding protein 34 [Saguinus oedipus]|uniref:RNA-binding protein 34 n=1 Tax=Saguinus oedipus TaxID=9490 RepID=A0ABQ9TMK8_SAGOE|nr:RNA-binding protein 34 [Saguinus oedipus]